jgi:MerR family transcriptional regulator/heat shock protein HspR
VIEDTKPVMTVGAVADVLGVCEQTLRLWEQKGLITPSRVNGRRLYSTRDLERLELVKFLINEKKMNIPGVKKFLEIFDNCKQKNCEDVDECLKLWDKEEK